MRHNAIPKIQRGAGGYTPAQRRLIDTRLSESEDDLKHRNTYGPFDTAADMIAHMKAALKEHSTRAKTKRKQ
jgi:hypothetical protein